jgi:hypothetical protein
LRVCASSEGGTDPSDVIFAKFTVVPDLHLSEVMTQTAPNTQESQVIRGKNTSNLSNESEIADSMII